MTDNWIKCPLSHLVYVLNGYAFKSQKYVEDGIRVIRIANVQDGYIEDDKPVFYPYETQNEISNYMLDAGDLLMSLTGNVGRVALLTEDLLPAALNQRVACLRIKNNNIVDREFLFYYFRQFSFQKECIDNAKGTAQLNMSTEWLKKYNISLPPLAEQKRIVEQIEKLFSKLEDAKEKAQESLEKSSSRKNAILEYAFSGKLTSNWRKNRSSVNNNSIQRIANFSKSLPNKDKRNIEECQQICEEYILEDGTIWYKTIIGAVGVVTNGSTPSRKCDEYWNGNIPWVSSGEVRNNIIEVTEEHITEDGFNNSSVKLLPIGTVLIAMIGEGKTRGQSAVLNIEATTNQNIAAIILEHGFVNSKFMWYWLQKEYKKNREKGAGSGPQALNCQRVRELEFVVPSIEEQNEIVNVIETLMEKETIVASETENVIDKIDYIKKAILAQAFRGELGTNNPDEDSSLELLKQIIES